jgi:archaemetzincin
VGEVETRTLRWLQKDIRTSINVPVEILDVLPVPPDSFDERRGQFHSTRILKELLLDVPENAMKVQGIISDDLHIPILTYVFGEAQLGGIASVVSLARLAESFHGMPDNERLFLERLHKESLHEIGHTFGLVHCHDRNCLMYLSNTIMDVDRKGGGYCRHCFDTLLMTLDSGR